MAAEYVISVNESINHRALLNMKVEQCMTLLLFGVL